MIRRLLVFLPLGGCLLDLPTPTINDDAGFDGSTPDTYVPGDGNMPDGMMMGDGGMDGSSTLDVMDGSGPNPSMFFTVGGLDPHLIDNDGTNLYFASGAEKIESLSIASKTMSPLSAVMNEFINDLQVVGSGIYFTSSIGNMNIAARCPTTGSCANMRTTYYSMGGNQMSGADADATYAYFMNNGAAAGGGGILRCPTGGGSCVTIKQIDFAKYLRVSADQANLLWATANGAGLSYCTAPACSSSGSTGNSSIVAIGSDTNPGQYYWLESGGAVWRRTKGGMIAQVAPSMGSGRAIGSDGTNIYWLTQTALYRCGVMTDCMSQQPEMLDSNLKNASDLTITSNAVYYTTRMDHTIWRYLK